MDGTALAQQGYEHYYGMLADKVRMQAYREAIFKVVRPGDVVVDLGAGTGLLGIWALQAGASKIYAIEKTASIELAREIARANHCEEKIEFINKNSAEVELPELADVLLSETLGSFGVDENTLQFTIDARQRFLKPGGRMIPQALDIYAAPVEDNKTYDKIDFWRHIDGINFSPAFNLFVKKIMVESVNVTGLLAKPVILAQLDLRQLTDAVFEARRYFTLEKAGVIHGVAGWFRVLLTEGVSILTAPDKPQTHWKQAFFPFQDPVVVIKGDTLDWSVKVGARISNSDDTTIEYHYRCTQLKNEIRPAVVTELGRNDSCPCGSGKKYKKCCL